MLRSLMTAVTGVKAHQTMLDVVGNNVANVNTTGYKRSTTVFQDLLYQNSRGASGPGDDRGGINPLQIGLGVQVAGVEMVNTPGPMQFTGQQSDVAINGNGYFVLDKGGQRLYSRAGNFSLDADGILDHVGTGFRVQGYKMEQDPSNPMQYINNGELGDIEIKIGSKIEAKPTSIVGFKCNLDSRVGTYLPFGVTRLDSAVTLVLDAAGNTRDGRIEHVGTVGTGQDLFTSYTVWVPDATGNGETAVSIDLQIDGIDNEGRPVLSLVTPAQDANIGTTQDKIHYDAENGLLQITNSAGAVKWSTEVFKDGSFSSFNMEDLTVGAAADDQYRVLLEVGESMDNGEAVVTMWMSPGGDAPTRHQFVVPVNKDGTFAISEELGYKIGAGPFDPAGSGDAPDVALPGIWTTAGMKLIYSASGQGFTIQATNGVKPDTAVAVVNQDLTAIVATKGLVYDCKGDPHTLEVTYKKMGDNYWTWEAFFPDEPNITCDPNRGDIYFTPCGKIDRTKSDLFVNTNVLFSTIGANDETITLDFSGESFGYDVEDLEGVTQYASETTTKQYYQDGYAMGVLNEYSVAMDGTINGKYSNGKTIPLYQLGLALFDNPMGLERVGNTAFSESVNSGFANIGTPEEGAAGSTVGGNLEMSNVDIAEEFTRLILAQRGFQANTRIVTVSDSILEEAVNMKR